MKILCHARLLAVSLVAIALAGCASGPAYQKESAKETMPMSMPDKEMKGMCEMHTKMMGSMPAEKRQSMMDEKMQGMSPEMKKKQMEMMSHCNKTTGDAPHAH